MPPPQARRRPPLTKSSARKGKEASSRTLPRKAARTASPTRSRWTARPRPPTNSCATRRTTATSKTPAAARTSGTPSSTSPCGTVTTGTCRWAARCASGTSSSMTRARGCRPPTRKATTATCSRRYLLHADVHLGPYFRFFGQIVTGLEEGRIGGPRPDIDQDPFGFHQAFADFVLPLAAEKDTLTARLGRQELEYGSGRLIDVRDGVNLRLSFDAARLLWHTGDWEVDGWWGRPVLNRLGVFDDIPDPARAFWGVYAVGPLPLLPKGNVDLYYLGFENKDAVYAQGPGYELRNTLGTRLWGRPLPWEYNLEYDWQFGTFGSGDIEAWSRARHPLQLQRVAAQAAPRSSVRLYQRRRQPGFPEPPNLQPAVPLGYVLQPPQPGGAAQYDRPAPDSRPVCRREAHVVAGLGLLLAGEPGRRRVQHLRAPLPPASAEGATSATRPRSPASGTRRGTSRC